MTEPNAETQAKLAQRVHEFVRDGYHPHFGGKSRTFPDNPLWSRLRDLGSELWLDTGSIDDAQPLWTRQFSALTTNNTLLNREVQKGAYDDLIPKAARLLREFGLSPRQTKLELAFILNARHGLKLVEAFDAYVSVEEHTDLANDYHAAVHYARRYFDICPERFIVKGPLSPAGVLATRRLADDGVRINHTLGFSARQNYLIARIGRPDYVNVFLGRLNAFVADNALGDGERVGEKAALAAQRAVRGLRDHAHAPSRLIAASLRSGQQIRDLAGLDVFTAPPKAARQFLDLGLTPEQIADKTREDYQPSLNPGAVEQARLDTLWEVPPEFQAAVQALEREDLTSCTPERFVAALADRGFGDLFPNWTDQQVRRSAEEGKIPRLDNWRDELGSARIGLDSLMNLAGYNSFAADQKEMDDRVMGLL